MNKAPQATPAQQFVAFLLSDLDGMFEEARFNTEADAHAYVAEHHAEAQYHGYEMGVLPADGFEEHAQMVTEELTGY